MSLFKTLAVSGLVALALTGCNRERPLEGERVDLRAPWGGSGAESEPQT